MCCTPCDNGITTQWTVEHGVIGVNRQVAPSRSAARTTTAIQHQTGKPDMAPIRHIMNSSSVMPTRLELSRSGFPSLCLRRRQRDDQQRRVARMTVAREYADRSGDGSTEQQTKTAGVDTHHFQPQLRE
jgi:hypothetical protein